LRAFATRAAAIGRNTPASTASPLTHSRTHCLRPFTFFAVTHGLHRVLQADHLGLGIDKVFAQRLIR